MKNKFVLLTMMLACLLFSTQAYSESHLGITYSQVADQVGWGLSGDTEFNLTDKVKVNASLNGQNTGTLYRGKLIAEASVPVAGFEVGVSSETRLQGYVLSELGHDTTYGMKASKAFGATELIIGLFGANAGEWGKPSGWDILVDENGFEPESIAGLGLEGITAPSEGLSIKNGNRTNLRIGLRFNLFDDRAEVNLSGRPELGADENPVHQLIGSVRTGIAVGKRAKLVWQGELGIQTWNEEIQREFATYFSLNFAI